MTLHSEGSGGGSSDKHADLSSPPRLVNVHVHNCKQHGHQVDIESGGDGGGHLILSTPTKAPTNTDHNDNDDHDDSSTQPDNGHSNINMINSSSSSASDVDAPISTVSSIDDISSSKLTLEQTQAPLPSAGDAKTMNVTVTVLSLHGLNIVTKKNNKSKSSTSLGSGSSGHHNHRNGKKKLHRRKGAGGANINANTNTTKQEQATIVASFSQNIGTSLDKIFLTHVPSLPVNLDTIINATDKKKEDPTNVNVKQRHANSSSAASVSTISSNGDNINAGGSTNYLNANSNSTNSAKNTDTVKPKIVHWPIMVGVDDDDGLTQALSTLQFKRTFIREGPKRYIPQLCPINLSISRNGRMALLGKVTLIINGEENGEGTVTVPVNSSNSIRGGGISVKDKLGVNKSLTKMKNIAKRGSNKSDGNTRSEKNENTSMIKMKGDVYQFGLEGGAMLRVLVNVSDPEEENNVPVKEVVEEKKMTETAADEYRAGNVNSESTSTIAEEEDNNASIVKEGGNGNSAITPEEKDKEQTQLDEEGDETSTVAPASVVLENDHSDHHSLEEDSRECISIDGSEESYLEAYDLQDDYQNNYMNPSNELRTLRAQLAESEQTNKILQMELANAQHTAQLSTHYQFENERLQLELQLSEENSNNLLEGLAVARGESEMLPFYETRVNEMLEELKRRDVEVDCLKDELSELRRHYKEQLSDSMLWDEDTDEQQKEGGAKGGAVAWEGVKKLGVSLKETVGEKLRRDGMDTAEALLWDNDDNLDDSATLPSSSTEKAVDIAQTAVALADDGAVADIDDGKGSLDCIKEEEECDSEQVDEGENTLVVDGDEANEEAVGDTQATKDEAELTPYEDGTSPQRGWGIRGIGASLMNMEEKMRIRQQQFREQQQLSALDTSKHGSSSDSLQETSMDKSNHGDSLDQSKHGELSLDASKHEDELSEPAIPQVQEEAEGEDEVQPSVEECKEEATLPFDNIDDSSKNASPEGDRDSGGVDVDADANDASISSKPVAVESDEDDTSKNVDESTNNHKEPASDVTPEADESVTDEKDDSPKRGWAVRGLGAKLGRMEEKMRIRQQKFREKQLAEQQKLDQSKTEQQGAQMSRMSSHGSSEDASNPALVKVHENCNTNDEEQDTGMTADATKEVMEEEHDEHPEEEEEEEDQDASNGHEVEAPVRSSYDQYLLSASIDELEGALFSSINEPSPCSVRETSTITGGTDNIAKALFPSPALTNAITAEPIQSNGEDVVKEGGTLNDSEKTETSAPSTDAKEGVDDEDDISKHTDFTSSSSDDKSVDEEDKSVSSEDSRVGLISKILSDGMNNNSNVLGMDKEQQTISVLNTEEQIPSTPIQDYSNDDSMVKEVPSTPISPGSFIGTILIQE